MFRFRWAGVREGLFGCPATDARVKPLTSFLLERAHALCSPSLMAMIYLVFCRLSAPPNIFTYYSNAARLLTVCYALDKASNDTSTRDCVTIFRVVCCAISIYIEMNI